MRRYLPLSLLVFLVLAGCDTVDEGNVFLAPRTRTFEFRVDGSSLTVGQQATVTATSTATLQGDLDGFSLDELVAARVTEVEIRRLAPLGSGNSLGDLLQSAQIAVTSGGAQQVASGSGFGQVTNTTLTPTGTDVAAILSQPQFSARMTFVPNKATAQEYVFEVTLTLALEVEGL